MDRKELAEKAVRLMKKYAVTAYEIEQNTKLTAAGVQKIINGETKSPLERTTMEIIEYIELMYENKYPASSEGYVEPMAVVPATEGVPYYDMDFAGGWDSDELFTQVKPSFFIGSPDFNRAEFACNLVGNSISNRIPSGAVIGLREVNDWKVYFPTNELYGLVMKNELRTVKVVKRDKENNLILIPDPLEQFKGYEPEIVPIDFVVKMFQVVAWARFERVAM